MDDRLMFFLDRNSKNILNSLSVDSAHQHTFFASGYAHCLAESGIITHSQLDKETTLYSRACCERVQELGIGK